MLKMLPTPLAWLVLVVGVAAVAYGLAMAVLYPAGGFFLVWIVAGVLLGWAGLALATRLVEDARSMGFKIMPLCPFVNAQRKKHPEWADAFSV